MRIAGAARFPARFLLAAAMNPCPCGWHGSTMRECRCSDGTIERYRARISGPLLDRIDLHVLVPAVSAADLGRSQPGERSAFVRARVVAARERQVERNAAFGATSNATLRGRDLEHACELSIGARRHLELAMERLRLSARAHDRILKVARTLADLANKDTIEEREIAEAVAYRALDRPVDEC